jgi:feruloyl esterase
MFSALENWVQHGIAPQAIVATRYANPMNPASGVEMTRPLCPYPQIAVYKGAGNTNEAANFVCRLPGKK